MLCFLSLISFLFKMLILSPYMQENVKTKHPQLLYESKLYRILQGGSKLNL
uniref:Casein kinase n=1 Tax=Rhizophora mucronata TaxID=61149 RepID=A0A2P2JSI4_RHIMU